MARMMNNKIQLFQNQQVRTAWDPDEEEWLFAIVDVIHILTESNNPQVYWRVLKKRLLDEGTQTVTKRNGLKMKAPDGKMRLTDVATTRELLRIIQSIPSKKAEPFKQWLAEVGNDRINETQNPELTINRAMRQYHNLGYSQEWINTRLQSIQFRKELTDEWKRTGIKEGREFAILTNIMTQGWSGKSIKEYKEFKGLKKESLRDNMTSLELALNMLAETSATELSKSDNAQGMKSQSNIARRSGAIAGNARKNIEAQTGRSVISPQSTKKHLAVNKKAIPNAKNKN